jgi:kynurenine aminotransferase
LAAFAVKNDIIVVADEVYDVLTYDNNPLIRLASLPGMADRTVTIGSAGKLFSVTGFKVGWAIGPADIISGMARIHQYVPFCVSSTMQEAVAAAIEGMDAAGYLPKMRAEYDSKRHLLVDMLKRVHLRPIVPQGSYFVVADADHVDPKRYIDPTSTDAPDWQFCKWLTVTGGVCAIPVSPFYHRTHKPPGVLARFAFCKTADQINQAGERLARLNLQG